MQKKIIALAIAGLASTAAFAQSNVTIYGVADVFYGQARADGHKTSSVINSGGLSGSRIGFKGVEDLGNGLKALFTLEYGLAIDQNTGITGDQANNAARQQFVGLTSNTLGTVLAGYLQTAGYDFACAANPIAGSPLDGYTVVGAASLLSCSQAGRASNAVAYVSPTFAGLSFAYNHARVTEANAYSLTVGASGTQRDSFANLAAVSYANGPISAGVVYSKIDAAATAVADNTREFGVRGAYDFGVAKLFASYQRKGTDGVAGVTNQHDSKWQVSAAVPVMANGTAIAMYARNGLKNNAVEEDRSSAITVAYTHALSKRTKLYAGYTHVSNDNNAAVAAFGVYGNAAGTYTAADKVSLKPTIGGDASVFALGVNHAF